MTKATATLFSLLTFLTGCKNRDVSDKQRSANTPAVHFSNPDNYASFVRSARKRAAAVKNDREKTRRYFCNAVSDSIPAYWSGTKWDFNGVTRQPQTGAIACGFFITNTLDDLGVPLDRVRLAQAPSSVLIKEMCVEVKRFTSLQALQKYVGAFESDAVFIAGLDFHTGYVIKENGQLYFLHSNYIAKSGVVKEPLATSKAFNNTKSWMIGCISENDALLRQLK